MAQDLVPNIGVKGLWTAAAPYDTALVATQVYTCVGLRTLAEVIASGDDAYTKYYKPYGSAIADFAADARAGICIVSLVSGNGQWRYIPSNKLNAAPVSSGVKYSRVVLGVQLGEIAEVMDLSPLTNSIQAIVHDFLAVTPVVHLTVTSAPTLKSQEEHDSIVAGIAAIRSLTTTDYVRNVELTAEVQSLRAKLFIAEQYILSKE